VAGSVSKLGTIGSRVSTSVLCWVAAGVAFAAVIVLVAADRLQVAMRRRRPVGRPTLMARVTHRPAPAPRPRPPATEPILVELEPPLRVWRRLAAALEALLLAAAVGFSLALALGITLFAGAFLLRQAVG
jgi:hypothetical protein